MKCLKIIPPSIIIVPQSQQNTLVYDPTNRSKPFFQFKSFCFYILWMDCLQVSVAVLEMKCRHLKFFLQDWFFLLNGAIYFNFTCPLSRSIWVLKIRWLEANCPFVTRNQVDMILINVSWSHQWSRGDHKKLYWTDIQKKRNSLEKKYLPNFYLFIFYLQKF